MKMKRAEIDDIFRMRCRSDMNADIIDIEDIDYGIWYVGAACQGLCNL
ncbi:MAG: hypothetical protein ACLSHW_07660 [Lachnospiraceae bacterium]